MSRDPRYKRQRAAWRPSWPAAGCLVTAQNGEWGFGATRYGPPPSVCPPHPSSPDPTSRHESTLDQVGENEPGGGVTRSIHPPFPIGRKSLMLFSSAGPTKCQKRNRRSVPLQVERLEER